MTFEDYSKWAWSTAIYPDKGNNFVYPALELAGEAGEVCEKLGKHIRDNIPREEVKIQLTDELGDVLWYINALAVEFGIDLDHVATRNIDKLKSRERRGKIHGSGDNR